MTLAGAVPAAAADPIRPVLPANTGSHPVGTTSLHLVDPNRTDPWVPAQQRELMITVSYPAGWSPAAPRAAWLEPGIAKALEKQVGLPVGSVDLTGVRRHARGGVPADLSRGARPVVLFSPGFGVARELGSILSDDLASRGYVVVSLSHTHDSSAVEFPGGRIEPGMATSIDPVAMKTAIDTRVADTRFLLDQLARLTHGDNPDAEHRVLPRGLGAALDLSRVGMFGHSYGGFTAGETMYHDRRIDAGINLDGSMAYGLGPIAGQPYLPGEVTKHGLDRPFLLMGSQLVDPRTGKLIDHDRTETAEQSWPDFWAQQRGWKRDLTLLGSRHGGYTDYQAIVPQVASLLPAGQREATIGTIDPERSLTAQRDYVSAFFDLHLRGRNSHLFDGPSPCYPDVRFV
ncbi:lipase [Pseudonocardiaceae bacterium YIM PH 21723]|nr:lipase [Pseudonocardiaceae bacterium YIM PH 21723]